MSYQVIAMGTTLVNNLGSWKEKIGTWEVGSFQSEQQAQVCLSEYRRINAGRNLQLWIVTEDDSSPIDEED